MEKITPPPSNDSGVPPSPEALRKLARPDSAVNKYAKYSGLGFQMLAAIGLGVWGGMKLDDRLNLKFPAFTIGLSCLALVGSLILLIRNLTQGRE